MSSMYGKEVAAAAGIWHTQVSRYAARLGVKPVGKEGRATLWPASLPERILASKGTAADARAGGEADEFWRAGEVLFVGRLRADGRRRALARIRLTPTAKRKLAELIR